MNRLTRALLVFSFIAFSGWNASGSQSTITEANGESCMGDDKSRRETEQLALESAKRMAVELTSSHVSSTTVVENFELKQDIIEAFTRAEVKLLDVLDTNWREQGPFDRCVQIRIRAEVIPAAAPMARVSDVEENRLDPRLPLNVSLWVNADDGQYVEGERLKIYLQGNKPFYARLVYVDALGNNIQLLPNQHRRDNYFQGATLFEVPEGRDQFELTVSGPFGSEELILYASTEPLGDVSVMPAGSDVYLVNDGIEQVGAKTRGIAIGKKQPQAEKTAAPPPVFAEFAESRVAISTRPR